VKQVVLQLDQTLLSAAEQALRVIMCTEVSRRLEPVVPDPAASVVYATIRLVSAREDVCVVLMLRCVRVCAVQMAARMLQMSEDEAAAAHILGDVMGEVVNILGGELKTAIAEQISDCVLGLPEVQEKLFSELPPLPEHAAVLHFAAGENLHFSVVAQFAHLSSMLS
jgi:hypothetical protein